MNKYVMSNSIDCLPSKENCVLLINKIKRLLKFKGIKKNDVDIYIDNWDNCISISYCLAEMSIEEALAIMEAHGYITEKDFGF